MNNKRTELIKRAIKEKLGQLPSVYTADDILIVANIDESKLKELEADIDGKTTDIIAQHP